MILTRILRNSIRTVYYCIGDAVHGTLGRVERRRISRRVPKGGRRFLEGDGAMGARGRPGELSKTGKLRNLGTSRFDCGVRW